MTKYLEKNKIIWTGIVIRDRTVFITHIYFKRPHLPWYNRAELISPRLPITDEEWARYHKPGLFLLRSEQADRKGRPYSRWVAVEDIMAGEYKV